MPKQRSLETEVLAWVEDRARQMLAEGEVAQWTAVMDEGIRAEVPEVDTDPAIRRDLDNSTAGALTLYLSRMPHLVPGSIDPTPEMQALGRTLAQRGADVSVLLRVYRVGQRVFWRELMQEVYRAEVDEELRAGVLGFLWEHLSRTLEHVVEHVVAAYVGEAEQRMRGSFARRVETVAAILSGEDVEPEEATALLGHPVQRQQSAFVLWMTDEAEHANPTGRLEQLAREIAVALRLPAPLVVPSGARTVWAWFASSSPRDLEAVRSLASIGPGTSLRVAMGEPAPGVAGFRSSHEEAVHAQAVAATTGETVVRYRDVALVSLLRSDEPAMRRFVARELGGLAAPSATAARLRETVLAHFHAGSSGRAAELLTVHKNTVLYRLQQAEQLLGRPLDERRLELESALRLAATYGADPDAVGQVPTSPR